MGASDPTSDRETVYVAGGGLPRRFPEAKDPNGWNGPTFSIWGLSQFIPMRRIVCPNGPERADCHREFSTTWQRATAQPPVLKTVAQRALESHCVLFATDFTARTDTGLFLRG
jgi:hypothetical protein